MKNLLKTFQNPGSAYRGKPFWSWNGLLEEDELRRQIRVMKQMGLGGFFMHSRVGLQTPYLSKEWFDLTRACIDEAKKNGMEAWLYDEDRWSSGAAGGIVTKNPKYRQRHLMLDIRKAKDFKWGKTTLAAFTAEINAEENTARNVSRLKKGVPVPKNAMVLDFHVELAKNLSWYNGYTYLDTISREAVKEFMRVTHEAYRKTVGSEFGKAVPGIFTDEPNYGPAATVQFDLFHLNKDLRKTPWTETLPGIFRKRYGYDILNHLPEILLDIDDNKISKARHDYFDCITFMFTDAFARQIGEWCGKNKLQFTGHVLLEGTPFGQTEYVGSAMRFYEHMQAPGIDILTQFWQEYDTAKQCASVLNQMGRTWMLSELYGCTGWYFTFEGHKAVGDWQAALGVNLRCQHLSWYTMEGEAKRDYPASIFYQSPWWQMYPKVEDYFARLGAVMTQGNPVRDLLVVHPVESAWLRMKPGNQDELRDIDTWILKVRDSLLHAHLDFDYGDEEMMSRLASVSKGKDGIRLRVGKASYRAVVVPPMITMRRSTLELLEKFAKAGGVVVFAGQIADYIDAEPCDDAKNLAERTRMVDAGSAEMIESLQPFRVLSIADKNGKEIEPALYMLRSDSAGRYLFICNTDRKNGFSDVRITLDAPGYVEEWDAETGQRYEAHYQEAKEKLEISALLPASGSLLYVIPNKKRDSLKRRFNGKKTRELPLSAKKWDIQLSEDNVYVLDQAQYKIRNGEFQPAKEILKADQAVRGALNIYPRGADMVQPWARPKVEKPTTPITLRYTVNVEKIPSGRLDLAMETPHLFRVTLNGHAVDTTASDSGWWTDRCIRRVPLDPALLVVGRNDIEMSCDFNDDVNLEASFLLGNFGVRLNGAVATIIEPVETLRTGNWAEQGLPFYSGSVSYRMSQEVNPKAGERAILRFPDMQGICARVLINGQTVGIVGWPPYELDITEFVGAKKIDLTIEVFGSRHNSFGPFHVVDNEMIWVGPDKYNRDDDQWQDEYNLKPYGLIKNPVIEFRK